MVKMIMVITNITAFSYIIVGLILIINEIILTGGSPGLDMYIFTAVLINIGLVLLTSPAAQY